MACRALRDGSCDAQNEIQRAIRLSRKGWPFSLNGAVLSPIPGAERARRSCPAGLIAEAGLRWCGDDAALSERRISMSKSKKKAPSARAVDAAPKMTSEPMIKKIDPGSKQSRVI